jgi:CBS domain-containing protein
MKLVRDYMRKEVVAFKPEDSIFTVAEKFYKNHISGAPVIDEEKNVVGVISETDIIRFMRITTPQTEPTSEPHLLTLLLAGLVKGHIALKRELEKLSEIQVKDLMSHVIFSISSDQPVLEAATMLTKYKVNRLPVIDDGKLVGIITRADLIRALID